MVPVRVVGNLHLGSGQALCQPERKGSCRQRYHYIFSRTSHVFLLLQNCRVDSAVTGKRLTSLARRIDRGPASGQRTRGEAEMLDCHAALAPDTVRRVALAPTKSVQLLDW